MNRRRHRNRYRTDGDDDDYNNKPYISIAEFMFYNKKQKVIDNQILIDIEKELRERKIEKDNNLQTELDNINTKDKTLEQIEEMNQTIKEKYEEDEIIKYWTTEEFIKDGIGFEFVLFKKSNDKVEDVYMRIIDLHSVENNSYNTENNINYTISLEDFNNAKWVVENKIFFSKAKKEFSEDEIGIIEDTNNHSKLYSKHKHKIQLFNSFEEFFNVVFIEDKKIDNIKSKNHYKLGESKALLKILNLEMPDDLEEEELIILEDRRREESLFYIHDVSEKRIDNINYRIALCLYVDYSSICYNLIMFKENDECYNYIDKTRIFWQPRREVNKHKYFFLDLSLNEYTSKKQIILRNKVIDKIEDDLPQLVNKDTFIITSQIYKFYRDRVVIYDNKHRNIFTEQENLIINQYKKLLEDGKTIKFGDVYISKHNIKIGDGLNMEFPIVFLDVIANFGNIQNEIKKIDNIENNYNTMYEELLQLSKMDIIKMSKVKKKEFKEFISCQFTINGIKIVIERDNNIFNINGSFCRIEDVYEIVCKAICYTNEEDFNKFVHDVSSIGIEWKKMISNGVQLAIDNPFHKIFHKDATIIKGHELVLRFSLLWDANKRNDVYLQLNDQKYLIKYKQKFKQHFNYPSIVTTIEKLKRNLNECIEGLDNNKIIEIVDNAIQEAKIVKQRGQQLVASVIKELEAIEETIEVDRNTLYGYSFIGIRSKKKYFVQKESLYVYRYEDGHWNKRCVVDQYSKNRIYEDRLANRLANVYNEPSFIHTL